MKMITQKMIHMHYKILLTGLAFLFLSGTMSGQSFSEKRSYQKSARVNREMTLEISNKYGTIQVTPWDKDSVYVKVEIEAVTSNLDRLHKMLEGVDVNISETNFQVRAETEFTQNINMLFESFKGMTNKLISYESRIQINYYINAPEYLNMKIVNKYGDVYMENNTGLFSLNLSNGSFKAGSLNEAEGIDLTFCDATIDKLNRGDIDASFSELEIGESGDLSVNSISSRFELKKIGTLDAESKRDKFYIGSAISVKGNSYFTDYRIDDLKKEINVVTKYGSFSADHIDKGVEFISITSSYSDINLTFDPLVSYNLDIKHLNTHIIVPEKNSKLEKKTLSEDKKEYMTFGTVGKNPGTVKVKIDATRGEIYLK
jgi:hypothetical protein